MDDKGETRHMNTYTHSASVRFVRALMEELPFPVKDLFIDGYIRKGGVR